VRYTALCLNHLKKTKSTHTEEQIAEALKERAVFTEVGNKALRIAEGTGDDPMEIYLLLDDYKKNYLTTQ